jgi:hypothetical protein
MRLSDYYEGLRKQADEAEVAAPVEEFDKVAAVTQLISEMDETEQTAFAQAIGLGKEASEEQPEAEADVSVDDAVVKQAEDIFTAGRIFARGLMAEAEKEG